MQPVAILTVRDDGATLWGLIREAREENGLCELGLGDTADGEDLGGHPIAVGDRAGLVEKKGRAVPCGFDRTPRHCENVSLHESIHPRDTDCR